MACYDDNQVERAIAAPGSRLEAKVLAHAQGCPDCAGRLEQARRDVTLIHDIKEARQRRRDVAAIAEELSRTGPDRASAQKADRA